MIVSVAKSSVFNKHDAIRVQLMCVREGGEANIDAFEQLVAVLLDYNAIFSETIYNGLYTNI